MVACRQKHQGMHWREASSDGLAALRTLLLNGGWDLYWKKQQVLPLAVSKPTKPTQRFGALTIFSDVETFRRQISSQRFEVL